MWPPGRSCSFCNRKTRPSAWEKYKKEEVVENMKTKTAEGKRMETNQSASASQLFPSVLLVFCFHLSFLILCRMEIHGPSLVNPLLREYVNDFQLPRDLHVKISALGSCHWHFSTCGFSFGHSSFISTTIGKARSTVEIKIRVGQRPGPCRISLTLHNEKDFLQDYMGLQGYNSFPLANNFFMLERNCNQNPMSWRHKFFFFVKFSRKSSRPGQPRFFPTTNQIIGENLAGRPSFMKDIPARKRKSDGR